MAVPRDAARVARVRAATLLVTFLFCASVVMLQGPIKQDPAYHNFADSDPVLVVPNGFNVLSNICFIIPAVYGFHVLLSKRAVFTMPIEAAAYWTLFISLVFVAGGSAYYHTWPSTATLFWDRLPMTIAFMSMVSIIFAEKINFALGRRLLVPLCVVGASSVLWWAYTEHSPSWTGDLRFYAVVQGTPMILTPMAVAMYPARYTHAFYLYVEPSMMIYLIRLSLTCAIRYITSIFYFASKVAEFADWWLWRATGGVLSGHTVKHVLASVGALAIPRMLTERAIIRQP